MVSEDLYSSEKVMIIFDREDMEIRGSVCMEYFRVLPVIFQCSSHENPGEVHLEDAGRMFQAIAA